MKSRKGDDDHRKRATCYSTSYLTNGCHRAIVLCASSILQLFIATELMRHARRAVQSSSADPPVPVKVLLPLWARGALLPWDFAVAALYALVAGWSIRSDRARAVQHIILLWILIATIFFAGVWLAIVPFRVCCM